jgi:hypothetical protein
VSGAVRLLPFPPPYRAAVTISNDLDDLLEPGGWWEFLRFLNTADPTRFGDGLDLEIGDSFWFWSDHYDEQPGAWFRHLGTEPSPFAPYFAALGRSGHLDTLHSYGNFSRHGGFTREHARIAAGVLAEEGFVPPVWVNHGGAHDFQNLWTGCGDVPENPEAEGAPAPEYHLDFTWPLGFRYAWIGELTRLPGQDRKIRAGDWLGAGPALRREAAGYWLRSAARRLAYRGLLERAPNYPVLGNRLLRPRMMRDGRTIATFVRYGDFDRATFADLAFLLSPRFLDALERSGGISIAFTHWCKHPGRRFESLDPGGLDALRELGRRARQKRLWVIAASRLLRYAEARNAVRVRPAAEGGTTIIRLTADPLPDGRVLGPGDLAGLSFAVPDPARVEVYLGNARVTVEPVPGEPGAVWVPLPPLVFPEPPREAWG